MSLLAPVGVSSTMDSHTIEGSLGTPCYHDIERTSGSCYSPFPHLNHSNNACPPSSNSTIKSETERQLGYSSPITVFTALRHPSRRARSSSMARRGMIPLNGSHSGLKASWQDGNSFPQLRVHEPPLQAALQQRQQLRAKGPPKGCTSLFSALASPLPKVPPREEGGVELESTQPPFRELRGPPPGRSLHSRPWLDRDPGAPCFLLPENGSSRHDFTALNTNSNSTKSFSTMNSVAVPGTGAVKDYYSPSLSQSPSFSQAAFSSAALPSSHSGAGYPCVSRHRQHYPSLLSFQQGPFYDNEARTENRNDNNDIHHNNNHHNNGDSNLSVAGQCSQRDRHSGYPSGYYNSMKLPNSVAPGRPPPATQQPSALQGLSSVTLDTVRLDGAASCRAVSSNYLYRVPEAGQPQSTREVLAIEHYLPNAASLAQFVVQGVSLETDGPLHHQRPKMVVQVDGIPLVPQPLQERNTQLRPAFFKVPLTAPNVCVLRGHSNEVAAASLWSSTALNEARDGSPRGSPQFLESVVADSIETAPAACGDAPELATRGVLNHLRSYLRRPATGDRTTNTTEEPKNTARSMDITDNQPTTATSFATSEENSSHTNLWSGGVADCSKDREEQEDDVLDVEWKVAMSPASLLTEQKGGLETVSDATSRVADNSVLPNDALGGAERGSGSERSGPAKEGRTPSVLSSRSRRENPPGQECCEAVMTYKEAHRTFDERGSFRSSGKAERTAALHHWHWSEQPRHEICMIPTEAKLQRLDQKLQDESLCDARQTSSDSDEHRWTLCEGGQGVLSPRAADAALDLRRWHGVPGGVSTLSESILNGPTETSSSSLMSSNKPLLRNEAAPKPLQTSSEALCVAPQMEGTSGVANRTTSSDIWPTANDDVRVASGDMRTTCGGTRAICGDFVYGSGLMQSDEQSGEQSAKSEEQQQQHLASNNTESLPSLLNHCSLIVGNGDKDTAGLEAKDSTALEPKDWLDCSGKRVSHPFVPSEGPTEGATSVSVCHASVLGPRVSTVTPAELLANPCKKPPFYEFSTSGPGESTLAHEGVFYREFKKVTNEIAEGLKQQFMLIETQGRTHQADFAALQQDVVQLCRTKVEIARLLEVKREKATDLAQRLGQKQEELGLARETLELEREERLKFTRLSEMEREKATETSRLLGLERERAEELTNLLEVEREKAKELEQLLRSERERAEDLSNKAEDLEKRVEDLKRQNSELRSQQLLLDEELCRLQELVKKRDKEGRDDSDFAIFDDTKCRNKRKRLCFDPADDAGERECRGLSSMADNDERIQKPPSQQRSPDTSGPQTPEVAAIDTASKSIERKEATINRCQTSSQGLLPLIQSVVSTAATGQFIDSIVDISVEQAKSSARRLADEARLRLAASSTVQSRDQQRYASGRLQSARQVSIICSCVGRKTVEGATKTPLTGAEKYSVDHISALHDNDGSVCGSTSAFVPNPVDPQADLPAEEVPQGTRPSERIAERNSSAEGLPLPHVSDNALAKGRQDVTLESRSGESSSGQISVVDLLEERRREICYLSREVNAKSAEVRRLERSLRRAEELRMSSIRRASRAEEQLEELRKADQLSVGHSQPAAGPLLAPLAVAPEARRRPTVGTSFASAVSRTTSPEAKVAKSEQPLADTEQPAGEPEPLQERHAGPKDRPGNVKDAESLSLTHGNRDNLSRPSSNGVSRESVAHRSREAALTRESSEKPPLPPCDRRFRAASVGADTDSTMNPDMPVLDEASKVRPRQRLSTAGTTRPRPVHSSSNLIIRKTEGGKASIIHAGGHSSIGNSSIGSNSIPSGRIRRTVSNSTGLIASRQRSETSEAGRQQRAASEWQQRRTTCKLDVRVSSDVVRASDGTLPTKNSVPWASGCAAALARDASLDQRTGGFIIGKLTFSGLASERERNLPASVGGPQPSLMRDTSASEARRNETRRMMLQRNSEMASRRPVM